MQAAGDANSTQEKVRIELRSILLSSKHGVSEREIENDYEMLLCQPLPYKALGFKDVQSLMRSMPDVAKVIISPQGDVTYHAVSDETTQHIQKLVSNQKSKRKIQKHGFRGWSRGGYVIRRGGRGGAGGRSNMGMTGRVRAPLLPFPRGGGGRGYGRVYSSFGDSSHHSHFPRDASKGHFRNRNRYSGFQTQRSTETESTESRDISAADDDDDDKAVRSVGTEMSQHDISADELEHMNSPLYNLKIGISHSGHRVISKPLSKHVGDERHGGVKSTVIWNEEYKDLRDVINKRRAYHSSSSVEEHNENDIHEIARNRNHNSSRTRKVMQFGREINEFQRNLPPRFQRLQKLKLLSQHEQEKPEQTQRRYEDMYSGTEAVQREPEVVQRSSEPEVVQRSSEPEVMQRNSEVKQNNSEILPSQEPRQRQTEVLKPVSATQNNQQTFPEVLEKVYKLLKSNGIWVSTIPSVYHETYGEKLNIDFYAEASKWPSHFELEQMAPSRYIVYPVPDALTKTIQVSNDDTLRTAQTVDQRSWVSVPTVQLPPIGSRLQVLFSFAYSAEEVYLQQADMEQVVYEMDEILNQDCPALSAPKLDAVVVGSLFAANYESVWYRAQVVSVSNIDVTVNFLDYGNREQVKLSDLRPIPQTQLITGTPAQAIKCAVRKTKAGVWCHDVAGIFTELAEKNPSFSALVVEHQGDTCVVDLTLPGGTLINDMLLQPAEPPLLQHQQAAKGQEQLSQQQKQTLVKALPSETGSKLFADDPEPLEIPDCEAFCVYICKVMSENTVLLRIIDNDYSERLDELEQTIADNFYTWPVPTEIKQSNIYAAMALANADDAEDLGYEEGGKEDQNTYHRVRVLREKKDGNCECYFPDHGTEEVVSRNRLRVIDPSLNSSLSYQAIMARLHGLDKLPHRIKPLAVQLLIKLLTVGGTPVYAVKRGWSQSSNKELSQTGVDAVLTSRVRKIISCMKDVDLSKVSAIYSSVYSEQLQNVEEVVKNIPGYGYWKEGLEIELLDTSHEEEELNINSMVLDAVEIMERAESEGHSVEQLWHKIFSSSTSPAESDSGSVQEGSNSSLAKDKSHDRLSANDVRSSVDNEVKYRHVSDYINQSNPASQSGGGGNVPNSGRALYTWNMKPDPESGSESSRHTPTSTPSLSSQSSVSDTMRLPKYWDYPLQEFVSVFIVRVENPSYFVGVPQEQRGALHKLETAMTQYFSSASAEPATNLLNDLLYAVKSNDVLYHRALFLNFVGTENVIRVFYPDHHLYDTVHQSALFLLPQQFYSLPFMASRMRLRGVAPGGGTWSPEVIDWFKTSVANKILYAVVAGEEEQHKCEPCVPGTLTEDSHIPRTLMVHLVDTSGSEDLVLDEYMARRGMAVCE